MTDIVDQIDQDLGCQQCHKALKPNGPSPDFCGESCQWAWHAKRASARPSAPRDYGAERGADRTIDPSVADRVAAIEELAAQGGVGLTDWQRQAIEAIYAGAVVTWPRRNGRATVAALMQAEDDQRAARGPAADLVIVDEVVEAARQAEAELEQLVEEYHAARDEQEPRPGWLSRWFRRNR